jgi:predicted dienelactone hydrolase
MEGLSRSLLAIVSAPFRLLVGLLRRERPPRNPLEAAARPGPHGVGVTTLKLADQSRRTERNWWYAGSKHRRLTTEVWYPALGRHRKQKRNAPLDRAAAPCALVIFAHGLSGMRKQSASFCRHLASRGYVVASPDFPLSKFTAPGGANVAAVLEQPRDVSFVIDRLLAASTSSGDRLHGAVDHDRIGMSGHSLGGLTSLLVAYGAKRDWRVKAIVPFAAPGWFVPRDLSGTTRVPAMVVGGTKDLVVNPGSIRAGYEAASSPKWFVEIAGAEHMRFADVNFDDRIIKWLFGWLAGYGRARAHLAEVVRALGGDIRAWDSPVDTSPGKRISARRQRELMRAFATPFFDAFLRGDQAAGGLLARIDGMAPEARIESQGAPAPVASG